MKSRLIAGVLAIMLPALAFGGNASYGGYAKKERGDSKEITFGKIGFAVNGVLSMPSGDIATVLNATIGPELSLTYRNFLIKDFHLQMSGDFMTYTGKVDITNTFSTVSAVLSGRYDLKLKEIPGTLYLSAGGGAGFETLTVGGIVLDNIDPQYRIGVGYEAAAFDNFTVRL
ncbi:MAG: hypothetical protein NTX32_04630 [Candidatus Firestonebacteria bacterium]|nr:hypothetical protein [Candidatus Firestonebacteria bacterium]